MKLLATVGAVAGISAWALLRSYSTTTTTKMATLAPVIALSHGGGPMPLLGDPAHKTIVNSLKNRIPKLLSLNGPNKPRAIALVTAHWQTKSPIVTSGAQPDLIYDYYGFPPESYEIKYPAPGDPAIAHEVVELFKKEGLSGSRADPNRGFDHGVFVPMKLSLPNADIPIVQISILKSEDPEAHIRMGKALRKLREQNIAIVGSGFASFHNIRLMMSLMQGAGANPVAQAQIQGISKQWNEALGSILEGSDAKKRNEGIKAWRRLPGADVMHPPNGGDHFMPLIVCTGAAGDGEVTKSYKDDFVGVEIFTYYWGAEDVA